MAAAEADVVLLRKLGDNVLSLPMLSRGQVDCDARIKKMSCDEMEQILKKQTRRPAERIRGTGAPQTARSLLEENKQIVLEKQMRKALERKNSREFVDRILAEDRTVNQADKAKDISRRTAQRGLSQYYKDKIAEKEVLKSKQYQEKINGGVDVQFFPFVEGETIIQNRQAEFAKKRDEMRTFLQKQSEENPPRVDPLKMDADVEYLHQYPLMPVYPMSARGPPSTLDEHSGGASASAVSARQPRSASARTRATSDAETGPHLARYPQFLSRAKEHMSRRVHDAHVRKALEDKVERTKKELEDRLQKRELEAQQWDDGMMVNDALRYDGSRLKNAERKRNAVFLQKQVEQRQNCKDQEVEARRAEPAGYWGPEEKPPRDTTRERQLAGSLVEQMETNQSRKLESRGRRLHQEKVVVDNSLAEMAVDRVKEIEKVRIHKEVLTTTWDSQRKIRQVQNRINKFA